MQNVHERDSIDKPSDFLHLSATTNFSCKGVFNQNTWGQILPRVCTLVLFIFTIFPVLWGMWNNDKGLYSNINCVDRVVDGPHGW